MYYDCTVSCIYFVLCHYDVISYVYVIYCACAVLSCASCLVCVRSLVDNKTYLSKSAKSRQRG